MDNTERKLQALEAKVEMMEANMEKHDNLLYGIAYLNVPGIADKIEKLEASLKRGFWILTLVIISGWLAIIAFVAVILLTIGA